MTNRELIYWAVDVAGLMWAVAGGACAGVIVYGDNPRGVGAMIALFLAVACAINLVFVVKRRRSKNSP